ncbi:MAG: hypothetical protein DLM58_13405 [Pseudonocardiales bacterium]|nr:MAG: hypothetical protein DLM58_13405 [Pseudonocardiales bacterium]
MAQTSAAVYHFSEDPNIREFIPHVAASAADHRPFVWAVGAERAPDYWFPRNCPRAMAWVTQASSPTDRDFVLGPGEHDRVHAVEYGWLDAIAACHLFVYALAIEPFRLIDTDVPHAYVAEVPVTPLGPPEQVGDLLRRHNDAGIQLRLVDNLWPWWDVVTTTSLGHSGIRLANALPRRSVGLTPKARR